MRDHVLLQAIARVNRPYEDEDGRHKPAGFVLDFVGIFENLQKALAFDSEDVEGTIRDLGLLKERFAAMMAQAGRDFLHLIADQSPEKAAEAALEHFRNQEVRQEYYKFFKELADLYEIISPDPWMRPYVEDYDQLARLYRLLRSAYEPGVILDRELMRKTARLVQEHTVPGAIQDAIKVYEINEDTLAQIAASNAPDTVKVFNLFKSLEQVIKERINVAPYLLSIGELAEQVVQAFQNRQITTQEALQRLEDLVREFNQAERDRAQTNLTPETFAVYWLLQRRGIQEAEQVAQNMAKAFELYPHWHRSDRHERHIRLELYKSLKNTAVKEDKPIIDQILNLIRRVKQ
jgi:type I restriction enzyme R subunit